MTVERGNLFDLTRILFSRLPDSVFLAAEKPLVVTVNGSLASGKKIITDAALPLLFDADGAAMSGKSGYDEYWRGPRKGRDVELHYIDAAYAEAEDYSPALQTQFAQMKRNAPRWSFLFSESATDYARRLADCFMTQRTKPGMTVMQNSVPQHGIDAGLSIFIENANNATPVSYNPPRFQSQPLSFRDDFRRACSRASWVRYVEVELRDPRLLADAEFMSHFMGLGPACDYQPAPAKNIERPQRTHVPIFGHGFPHPA